MQARTYNASVQQISPQLPWSLTSAQSHFAAFLKNLIWKHLYVQWNNLRFELGGELDQGAPKCHLNSVTTN